MPIEMKPAPQVPYKMGDQYIFMDLTQRLFRERILLITGYITSDIANNLIAILLYLRNEDSTKSITLYCNGVGGEVRSTMALYDTIESLKEGGMGVSTLNLGFSVGMGAFLCSAGTPGRRYALPNARFLMQKQGLMEFPVRGQASDIALEVSQIMKQNRAVTTELSKMTGQTSSKLDKDLSRDFYLTAEEAVEYGLIDKVLEPQGVGWESDGKGDSGMGEFDSGQKFQ
ncbi:hypothetical protein TrVE_jg5505 [Triparma verrucosa]|uniref:ATP-dependent Clp protease proteolytic subunit n=2 Tax=Triparma TaxID=722752 RepID=A0A9W7E049_9STRA|nr:hypothetical protein TrST_g5660 [Triparma strigata]GMI14632.1 hypothetical protein TrVE_jg5505 [Triparma verrucosa]